MEEKTFSELLMSGPKLEVLRFLANNQSESFTINEISESVEASYSTVNRFVKELSEFGALNLREKGSAKLVSVNKNSPYIDVLEEIGSLDARPLRELAEDYAEEFKPKNFTKEEEPDVENISCIVLFGSVAQGMPDRNSDVDILVLVEDQRKAIERVANSIADKTTRETDIQISPLVIREKKFRRDLESGDPLANRIAEEGEPLIHQEKWRQILDE